MTFKLAVAAGTGRAIQGSSKFAAPLTAIGLAIVLLASAHGISGLPTITQPPLAVAAFEGTSATFQVIATGEGLSYRWLFNDNPITHPNAPTLTVSNLTPQLAGLYRVEVSNPTGVVASSPARLTVCTPGLNHTWQGRPWVTILQTGDPVPNTANTFGPLKAPFTPIFSLRDKTIHAVARSDGNAVNAPLPTTALVRWKQGILTTLISTNTPLPEGGDHFLYPYYPTDEGDGAVNFQQASMYELRGSTITPVLTPATPVPGRPAATFGPSGSFARRGSGVLISAAIDNGPGAPGGTGMFFHDGSVLTRIADDTTDLPGVMSGYAARLTEDSVNFDGETIVFSTMASISGPGGVYRATPAGVITKLMDSGDLIPGLTNQVVSFGDVDVEGGAVFAVVGSLRQGVVANRILKFESDGTAQVIGSGDFLVASGPRQVYFGTSSVIQRWTDGVVETILDFRAILGCRKVKYFLDVEAQNDDVAVAVEFADGSAGIFANFGEPTPGLPAILGQPRSITVPETAVAEFAVVATGPAPLSYQWFKNGTPLAGATNASLVLLNVTPDDAASYRAVVTSGGNSASSLAAELTLTAPPSKPVLFIPPVNVTAPVGSPAALNVVAAGAGPLTYKWTKGALVVAEGPSSQLALSSVSPADHGTYQVLVSNATGAAPAYSATLSVTPLITQQPESVIVAAGATATFTVAAAGFPELRYQWYKGASTPLVGQTNSTLELKDVQLSNAGVYSVQISGVGGGGLRSANATLTISDGGGPGIIVLGAPTFTNGKLSFLLPTIASVTYEVQFKSLLSGATWSALQTILGDGTVKTVILDASSNSGFARVAGR